MRTLLSLLLLSGCQYGLDAMDSGVAADDSADDSAAALCEGQAVCISSVEPSWGPTSGGTLITVRGQGFGPAPELFFGNAALDVTVLGEGALTVRSPSVPVEGGVDVRVEGGGGSYVLTDGFTYSDSGPVDDTGDDTGGGGGDDTGDTDPQPSGLTGGIVEAAYTVVGCPDCFYLSDYLSFSMVAVFHAPTSASWYGWLPTQGSCAVNPVRGGLVSSSYDLGQWAYLSSGATSLPLRKEVFQGLTLYNSGPLTQDDLVRSAAFDLSVPDGGSLGPFEILDVLETTSGFDDIQPISLLNDQNQAFSARISASNASFTWAPSSIAESFVVSVSAYHPQSGAFLGEVACHTSDSGRFTVPSGYLSAYPANALLSVELARLQRSETVNPADGSTIEGSFSIGILGTATLSR